MKAKNVLLNLAQALRFYPGKGKAFLWKEIDRRCPDLAACKEIIQTDFREGFTMNLNLQDIVQRMMIAGAYERRTTWFFKKILAPGDCFIDGGAYVGYYSLLSGVSIAPGTVHAFEPNPQLRKILGNQTALNPGLNIKIHEYALSNQTGSLSFYFQRWSDSLEGQALSTVVARPGRENWQEIKVKSITLDEFIKREKIGKVVLCKLDLEGGEASALEGARECLRSGELESLIVEVTEDTKEALINELMRYDFEEMIDLRFNKKYRSLKEIERIGDIFSTNVLFARGACAARFRKIGISKWFI